MSAPTSERTDQKTSQQTTGAVSARKGGELVGEHGRTAIADTVVAKIAGMAASEVQGVYAMGAGMARAFGAVRERIPGVGRPNVAQGVAVEVGERQAAIDVDVIVEYGVSIPDLGDGIRRNVIEAVEKMCGLDVTEVNVNVGDIHLPGEESRESGEPAAPRVR
ncbi:Asp23/Gls24 family envelope stress response protein [Actinoallomurus iriomotensis]|uniref:Stress protein n=1 Tax=Actinoallomurus iriomotensis TaxID=478107 RepID=A0A9W6RJB2_9ACTN|nr:Asp23/Gls24 family envelope stress response protein [Actinoallomurus iriomotensis]GLY75077.1 stress protein [Actinoallomurus iriomotensis]